MKITKKLQPARPWDELKDLFKHKFILLTDYDLIYEEGKEDELLTRLGKKMKKSKRKVRKLIESYE